ncbi:MAG: efflux RND transporter periplasmic adaptor subunit [Candidatus Eisenbacteria bacterium]|uniref:Efflux RND transporter periplasmic adaptor subunit n=1 Tax=Eiseniibacteriota bacterium TaxID=2212470 RepID=A0A948W5C8_UNCEI|nr:efflux RND transporter periplasmic adaptor subunit [Candidatus Eisenbacteria bacterium]MBU1948284.1 efflux RND transporter periplasmic adaptor subunit [Candidatus Eisenbacteria bacterium]MBU2689860.1 efflux RND transporter periplasmic adaptor subunit [Candidatus Eisenbacteria bacterium]
MKRIWFAVGIVCLLAMGVWRFAFGSGNSPENRFSLDTISKGNIRTLISGTGTLNPTETVDIGTQISGTIAEIYVDFNDQVQSGQILAKLDTSLLEISVRDAEAELAKIHAQCDQAAQNMNRYTPLHEQGLISDEGYIAYQTNSAILQASLKSAQAALDRARINLDDACIRSPIAGVVIQRNIEEGQTVAASLSTPTLFTIAKDLRCMQILAQVDENDIGSIRDGQSVEFSVAAYPSELFTGRVTQIRLQPEIVQNVVNYIVVIETENPVHLLLPGMTATVDFIVEEVQDILTIANSALKFQPSREIQSRYLSEFSNGDRGPQVNSSNRQPYATGQSANPIDGSHPGEPAVSRSSESAGFWYLDETNRLKRAFVETGITDGVRTEIAAIDNTLIGRAVITGQLQEQKNSSGKSFMAPKGRLP